MMGINSRGLGRWGMSLILAVASMAMASGDHRLVDAVKSRDTATVRALLKQHVDVNAPQGDGATALHWAAHWDDLETATLLIRAGANVNAANDFRITPLMLACTNRNAAMVETLLKAGANANAARANGETVLMTCARTGNVAAVNALLAHGADVQAKENGQGQTALMWAAVYNHVEVMRTLIEHGADINARTTGEPGGADTGRRPRPNAVDASAPAAPTSGPAKAPSCVGVRCADSNQGAAALAKPRGMGFTAVLFAARGGARDAIEVLLAKGANVNDTASDDNSVLQVALSTGHWDLAPWLLEHGADPNADGPGYTPLHWAAGYWDSGYSYLRSYEWISALGPGKLELVKTLLAHGANPNARIKRAPRTAYYGGELRLAGATALVAAGIAGNVSVMRALLAAGADPRLAADDGTTALMTAAGFGKDVPSVTQIPFGDALEATKLALELGIDVNAANTLGETALHGAAYYAADSVVQVLVDHGANVNARNRIGVTPMTVAQGYGGSGGVLSSPSTVALLRKLGGVGDVQMADTPIAELRAPCPQPTIFVNLTQPGTSAGRLWFTTKPATQYVNGTCADLKAGTTIRVKGVREVDKDWDGSVLASEIEIVK